MDICLEHMAPQIERILQHRRPSAEQRAVRDKNVQPAERDDGVDRGGDVRWALEVEVQRNRFAAAGKPRGCVAHCRRISAREDAARAFAHVGFRDREADAAVGPGYERGSSLQQTHGQRS